MKPTFSLEDKLVARARRLAGFMLLAACCFSYAQSATNAAPQSAPQADHNLLTRHYQEGEKLSYHMKGTNRDHSGTRVYEAQATGVVKKNAGGKFIEEYAWSNLIVNS